MKFFLPNQCFNYQFKAQVDASGFFTFSKLKVLEIAFHGPLRFIRELTNRRLSHDDAVGLRDMPTAHAFVGSCRRRAKVDDVVLSKFTASPKQKNVR